MTLLTKGMGAIIKKIGTASRNKASKKLFKDASGYSSKDNIKKLFSNPPYAPKLQHPVIKSFKPKKNLHKRRKDQQEMIEVVDKKYKDAGVKPGHGASKIKRDAAKKISDIHDKYEKKK